MRLGHSVFAAELVYPATGIQNFLLTRIKRMTRRAHFYSERVTECGAGRKFVAATTGYFKFTVVGVNLSFHRESS